jgi:uncharacterized protein YbjT (DUF2867 family)
MMVAYSLLPIQPKGHDMTILVTGSSGSIGSQVVARLAEKGAAVRALMRSPEKAKLPEGVVAVKGDMTDVESMQAALQGVSTVFLLNAVVPDELTQALIALSLVRDAGIKRIVYFSVFNANRFTDVPHFTSKFAVERMIEAVDLPATVLRPCYFMQNDLSMKDALLGPGLYPMPVGGKGVSMVDTRDIADVAAAALLQRENTGAPLPREVIELVGAQALTGAEIAAIWSDVLEKSVNYGGDDLDGFETQMREYAPSWLAREIRLMLARFQHDGMAASPGAMQKMSTLLGRAPRSYRDFALETAAAWKA